MQSLSRLEIRWNISEGQYCFGAHIAVDWTRLGFGDWLFRSACMAHHQVTPSKYNSMLECSFWLCENAVVSRGEFFWLIWSVSHSATKNLSSANQFRVDSFPTAAFGLTCSMPFGFPALWLGHAFNSKSHDLQPRVREGTHCDLMCSILLSSGWCGYCETHVRSSECLLEDSSSSSRTTSEICRRFGIFSKLQASLFSSEHPCHSYKSVKYGRTAVLQEACRLFRLLTPSNYFCGSLPAWVPV